MEKDLSHQIDVDVEVLLGGVDGVMAHHLFNLGGIAVLYGQPPNVVVMNS